MTTPLSRDNPTDQTKKIVQWFNGSNGQMAVTLLNYRSRKVHRSWNGENA